LYEDHLPTVSVIRSNCLPLAVLSPNYRRGEQAALNWNQIRNVQVTPHSLNNIYLILNPSVKSALIHDLDELDDSKRTLASIDNLSVSAIFSIFDLKDPHCDTNKDGSVSGDELRCFSKIWKNFVPNG
jgi:hypothetical protein